MTDITDPTAYEAWYHTRHGRWIGDCEFNLLHQLLRPEKSNTLLDVGCGTGYFSRRFASAGMQVVGTDLNPSVLKYARIRSQSVEYVQGDALALPFRDQSFYTVSAITSLCFIEHPDQALHEMWRVSKNGLLLGLLNRHSLLHMQKSEKGGYKGARWDTLKEVKHWVKELKPEPIVYQKYALFLSGDGTMARTMEKMLPNALPVGAFLGVMLIRPHE